MSATPFQFVGERLLADPGGALIWPARDTLAVADLHLEKGSAFAIGGTPLPPYDSRETLRRLDTALAHYAPKRVICLGDSFHDGAAAERLSDEECATLRRLTGAHDWLWIAGNHDPVPPGWLGGAVMAGYRAGPLIFRHEAERETSPGEVSGHYHPKATVRTPRRKVTGRCFVTDGNRLILPAFGAYAGGLDVRDPAIERLLRERYAVLVCGRTRVHRIPREVILRRADAEDTEPRLI